MMDKELDEFLIWVEANRDTPARRWADEVEPELRRQLQQLIIKQSNKARNDEVKLLENSLANNKLSYYFKDYIKERVQQLRELNNEMSSS